MPALSPMFISILEGALRAGATQVRIASSEVTLLRAEAQLGTGTLPSGAYPLIAAELETMGARPGATSRITIHSPVGPIELHVEMGRDVTILRFARDAKEAQGEAALSALLRQAEGLGADGLRCVPEQVAFLRGEEMLAVAALDDPTREALIAYGRIVGGVGAGETMGKAVLMSASGQRRILDVELLERGVAFSLG